MSNMICTGHVIKLGMLLLLMGGCGYQPVYGGERPEMRLSVTAAPHGTPHLEAVQAAVSGVRRSLSRAGVLRPGTGYPQVVVEVVRVDERPAGIQAVPSDTSNSGQRPLARATLVGVVGRAWVQESQFGPKLSDTGDVRRNESYQPGPHPTLERLRHREAISAAGHALGQALGRRILREPETTLEPI